MLELGTGFAFIGRQVRFTFDEEHFMVDLVFYNRLLRCFVLFDLKIGMSHYLRLKYDKIERYGIKSCSPGQNFTINFPYN